MIEKTDNLHRWLEFEKLQAYPELRHAVTLKGTDKSFILNTFGPISELRQVHGTECIHVHEHNALTEGTGDALFTTLSHRPLAIRHADCQAAILFDPLKQAVAVIHAGWKGLINGIYPQIIQRFKILYSSKPEDLILCIGPSLSPESSQFLNYQKEIPPHLWSFEHRPFYFDLWKIAEYQALNEGLLLSHIEIARLDTFQDLSRFHSWRGEKATERHYTVAMLD